LNPYRLAIFIIILAFLGGYAYFWGMSKPETGQETENAHDRIFNINPKDAEEIALRMKGLFFLLEEEGGRWRLEKPHRADVDSKRVEDILLIFDYGIVEVIDEDPSDYAQYGLDRPELEIGVRVGGFPAFQTLLIGKNNPTNICSYAKVKGRPEVFLVGTAYRGEVEDAISYVLLKK